MKRLLWTLGNWYGYLTGFAWLAPLNHALLNLSLHGLGYDNIYCTGEEHFIRSLREQDIRVAFDVGANVGDYSRMLKRHLDAEIYAFEPAAAAFEELQKVDDVRAFHTAIADYEGRTPLHSKGPRSPRATLDESAAGTTEEVSVTTLDAFIAKESVTRIDLLKIDVEGFEREVLLGAHGAIAALKPRYIQFEFNNLQLARGYTVLDLSKLLPGYELYRLLPHGILKIDPHKFASNIFIFSNYVAIHREGIE